MEALLGDLKRQMKDLSTAYPQPDHDGQFITQQSTVAVKEDPEDEEDPPQSLWHQNPWSKSFQRLKPERQRWLQILWERRLSRIIGRSSWSTRRLSIRYKITWWLLHSSTYPLTGWCPTEGLEEPAEGSDNCLCKVWRWPQGENLHLEIRHSQRLDRIVMFLI